MEDTLNLFSLNSLRRMEVIDISSGSRMGAIKDFVIDCENYKIESLIIPVGKMSVFTKGNYIEVPWEKIYKIGVDVILLEGDEYIDEE